MTRRLRGHDLRGHGRQLLAGQRYTHTVILAQARIHGTAPGAKHQSITIPT